MNRFSFLCVVIFMLSSCTSIDVRQTLNDVESYIFERPDSALSVLQSIDTEIIDLPAHKAHYALLYSMALDKNYIDVIDDSIARIAVDYYQRRGPRANLARSLYYLGKSYYYQQEFDKAILEYSKAEKAAAGCDSLYLGMIKSAQARIYNRTYNSKEELKCISDALEIFQNIGCQEYIRPVTYSLGVAYHNADKYSNALATYMDLINSSSEIDYYLIASTISAAHSMIEMSDVDYSVVDSLFKKAKYEYNADFTSKDYWAWAYSLYRIGEQIKADEIVENIDQSDELTSAFWKLRIAAYFKDYRKVYHYNMSTIRQHNKAIETILEESLASYQRDYYQSQLEFVESKAQMRTMELMLFCIIAIFSLIIISFIVIRYVKRQNKERNKLLEYVEEIKRQIKETENNDALSLKKKYISLYRARFEIIGSLCDQYLQANGRTDIESLMFKKMISIINEVRNDSVNRASFEAMLDADLDMVMTNIRREMPKLKELDYSIFSYFTVGFDATTISRLLDMTVNNVYVHKRRLRVRIEERKPEHRTQFLELLS